MSRKRRRARGGGSTATAGRTRPTLVPWRERARDVEPLAERRGGRDPLVVIGGLAAALSMGDLGVIALFAAPEGETLPLLLYRLMAAYRMDEAAANTEPDV